MTYRDLAVMVGRVEGKLDTMEESIKVINEDVGEVRVQMAKMETTIDRIEENTNGAAEMAGRVIDRLPIKTKQLLLLFLLAMLGGISGAEAISVMG